MKKTQCILAAVVAGTLGMACSGAMGAVYNADVTRITIDMADTVNIIDDGGTYQLDMTAMGRTKSNVSLQILGGSTVDSFSPLISAQVPLVIGYTAPATGSSLLVEGTGSTLTVMGTAAPESLIGAAGISGQSMTVKDGGATTIGGGIIVGRRTTSSNNSLTVDNGTFALGTTKAAYLRIGGDQGSATAAALNNSVTVKNGGVFSAGTSAFATSLTIGFTGSPGSIGNSLTLASGGLFSLDNSASTITVASGNFIRLDGGYLAWKGTHSLSDSVFQVWDSTSSSYIGGVLGTNYTATYYADAAAAQAATGFADLGDYTVFTNAVPEPASMLLSLSGVALLSMRRRRQQ